MLSSKCNALSVHIFSLLKYSVLKYVIIYDNICESIRLFLENIRCTEKNKELNNNLKKIKKKLDLLKVSI